MKKLIVILSFAFLLPVTMTFAQQKEPTVLDGIYVKEHVPARKPVPYHHLREADQMWNKKIWRMIDLREKINHPLFYPLVKTDDRYSLIALIMASVESGDLEVYDTGDDEFTTPMTIGQIDANFDAIADTQYVDDVETGESKQTIIPGVRNNAEVTRLMMKEIWYFDKQRSMLEVRIVGLCPIRMAPPKQAIGEEVSDADEEKELTPKKVLWVYFPAVRPILANHEVFNPFNDAERRTFDDIFFKRRFNSYIFAETNVYDNRIIGEYRYGLDALLESDKIKDWMFRIEHDLWEF
ncbi:MAG: gliding motility protein GldN [Bacteroidetes bacterium HGW-Bacteroidetes-21]|jgi:gliding motility associated protien GldN|nr:MAG: gliding motility protein GldN [Bacteroidetes bacterium HGW-Bacteroidetes-21]